MSADYDLGRAIVDELLPYNIEYYFGLRKIKPKHIESSDLSFFDRLKL